eukprot:1176037-Pyramimonas_sp.AAC.1
MGTAGWEGNGVPETFGAGQQRSCDEHDLEASPVIVVAMGLHMVGLALLSVDFFRAAALGWKLHGKLVQRGRLLRGRP